MKKKTRAIIWIIVGIAIISIPIVGRLYYGYQQDKTYNEYLKTLDQEIAALNDGPDVTSEGALELNPLDNTVTEASIKKTVLMGEVIGRIKIPSIYVDLLLLEGSYKDQLNRGAGHVAGTLLPGERGNCAIAGHRNGTFGSYFSRLGEVVIGTEIIVTYKGTTFTYRVYDIFAVTPDELWVMETDGSPIITLITCHPKGNNTHRLIVRAALVP